MDIQEKRKQYYQDNRDIIVKLRFCPKFLGRPKCPTFWDTVPLFWDTVPLFGTIFGTFGPQSLFFSLGGRRRITNGASAK